MALAFIFIDEEHYKTATTNFFLVLYLGVIAVLTIVIASFVQLWFSKKIKEKTAQQQDATSYKFLRYVAIVCVYFLGTLLAILAFPSLRDIDQTMIGTVTDITLRHTVIRDYENKMIVIPNAIINKEKLVNYDLGERKCCQWIEI